MTKKTFHCLYLSVCIDNIRRYYLMPCKVFADVEKSLFLYKGALIDANIVYSDDMEEWRLEVSGRRIGIDMSERMIGFELANCKNCLFKSLDDKAKGKCIHNYLGRSICQYVSAGTADNTFVEIVSLVRAKNLAEAYAQLLDTGSILMEMNYFDADFGCDGETVFLGVRFIHKIPRRLPTFACLCKEESFDQDWQSEVLSDTGINKLLEDIKRVDDNRGKAGLTNLGS